MAERPLQVIECKREPNENLIKELEKALELARSGELRSAILAGVLRDDSTVTMWAGSGRQITLLGAIRLIEHEVILCAAGVKLPEI